MYRKKKRKSKPRIHVYEVASEHMQHLEQQANHIKQVRLILNLLIIRLKPCDIEYPFLQEEKLKQEADNILSSVIQKKADARYQIQLLQNLLKLHSARVHQLTVETNFTPDTSITGFEKVLSKFDLLLVKVLCNEIENNVNVFQKSCSVCGKQKCGNIPSKKTD